MLVNEQTKIAAVLAQHPEALEAIVSINPRLGKLRNPFLRRLMAGRTSIGMAAKMVGCREDEFFRVLQPLGFKVAVSEKDREVQEVPMPLFLQQVQPGQVLTLDVRPVLAAGNDPLKQVMAVVRTIQPGQVLKIINTFEPTPLMMVLEKQGFRSWNNTLDEQLTETWFFKETAGVVVETPVQETGREEDWREVQGRYASRLVKIDVRELEMPQPMIKILEALEQLPQGHALLVVHKRIPLYLLPELAQRGFSYRSRLLSETEVHLLIFKQ